MRWKEVFQLDTNSASHCYIYFIHAEKVWLNHSVTVTARHLDDSGNIPQKMNPDDFGYS